MSVTILRKVSVTGGTVLRAANNLGDVADAATAFAAIKQPASTSATGAVELATDAEVRTGESDLLVPPVAGLHAGIALYAVTRGQRQGHGFSGAQGRSYATLASAIGTKAKTLRVILQVPAANPAAIYAIAQIATAAAGGTARSILTVIDTDGTLFVQLFGATGSDYRRATLNTNVVSTYAGKWIELAVVRTASTLVVYINGRSVAFTETTAGTAPAWTDTINGTVFDLASQGDGLPFAGGMLDVGIYNRSLSSAEALALVEAGVAEADFHQTTQAVSSPTRNSAFSAGATDWAAASGGAITTGGAVTITPGSLSRVTLPAAYAPRVNGAFMQVSLTVASFVAGTDTPVLRGTLLGGNNVSITGSGTFTTDIFACTSTSQELQVINLTGTGAGTDCTFTITDVTVEIFGLLCALESNAPGVGPQRRDMSGNAAHLNLPGDGVTGGVAWALPGGPSGDFGETRTATGYLLGRDAEHIPAGYRIARIWCSGDGTFSLGGSAGDPTSVVNAFTATATTQPATLAAYTTSTRKLYLTLGTATTVTLAVHLERI